MNTEEKLKIVKEVGEEIVTEQELTSLFQGNTPLITYDGFEPSGKIHLPQGIIRAININKMISVGCEFKMLIADWHAWANHKLGGDLGKIQTTGEYFIEIWRATGMNLDKVEFIRASDLVKKEGYWETVMKIAIQKNLPRVIRTVQVMGREETDTLSASQIIYPLMQAADIFMLEANITQLGMDQRKVNMLAREVAEDLGYKKPVVISHHMLAGLLAPTNKGDESAVDRSIRLKMSKSKPDSAIFMTDSKEDVERKIKQAWAPEKQIQENPILEYAKYLVFAKESSMLIKRPTKFGGDIEYSSYEDLEKDYESGNLFPLDLKNALVEYINKYLDPVREHFEVDARAKQLKKEVESFNITR